MIISFAQKLSKYLMHPYRLFSEGRKTRYYEKLLAYLFFSLEDQPFFFKNFCFQQPKVLQKWPPDFQINWSNAVWNLINCPLRFVTLDNTRQNGPKTFVIVKTAIFWNVCFYRPLRTQRNDLISCTKTVKKPCEPLKMVLRGLSFSIISEKICPKSFLLWEE